jgi:GrpB-like predicted nucleotidyltransferase (UPF0157 family)/GNAT superfamily N-acetyltransferase
MPRPDDASGLQDLGVERGTVILRPHSPAWLTLGQSESGAVALLLRGLAVDVQHVGSTAISGLDAKPILDLAVALASRAVVSEVQSRLALREYEFRGDQGSEGGLLFVKTDGDVRSVHLHAVDSQSEQWANYLRFRDHLRRSPSRRDDYRSLKLKLAARYPADRAAYTTGKHRFIRDTLALDLPRIEIRRADVADAPEIAHVHVRSWRDAYRNVVPSRVLDKMDEHQRTERWRDNLARALPDEQTWIACVGGDIVGFASIGASRDLDTRPSDGELRAIYVVASSWRQGVGSALHAACLEGLRGFGFERAILWVLQANPGARGFYEARGWIRDGGEGTHSFGEHADLPVIRYSRSLLPKP